MLQTKICSKCKKEQPISEFHWRNKAQQILHSQCKTCEKERDKLHYQESKKRRQAVRLNAAFQKDGNLNLVDQIKSKGCKKCGDTRLYVLDFHHRDPNQKTDTISHMIKSSNQENLLKELSKCDVLCANCHREFHFLQTNANMSYEEYINAEIAQ